MTEEIHCVWNMGTPCEGKRYKELMFDKQLEIPICEKHVEEHKEVMILHANAYDIEEIVDMEPEERKRLVYTMVLAGLDVSGVSL
jgi:hypothetical protein